ncbi:MAG: lytic transglycosylase F [Thermodesulfobacteriota bacterium]
MNYLLRLLFSLTVLLFFSSPSSAVTEIKEEALKPWTGDYKQMVERRLVRFLVPYSKTFYFFDGASQRGLTYEVVVEFEKELNKLLKTRHLKVQALIIPTPRDKLIPHLVSGRGDVAVGNLTITDERLKSVDFSNPLLSGVDEILVGGPKSPEIKSLFSLSGQMVMVRKSSSYYASLVQLNNVLESTGKSPVIIIPGDENLEDEDILEMVKAGLVPFTVVDNHKAQFWERVLPKLKLYKEIKLRSDGRIGWAVRKNSPQLKQVINGFVKKHKKGTLFGNVLFNRYLKETKYITDSVHGKEMKRFQSMVGLFERYGDQYDFDFLMLAALGYQESRLIQSRRSRHGAMGVMQILPSTARDKNVGIINIEKLEPNIHAGTKYLRFLEDRYFNEPAISRLNQQLFAVASYNAGPAKVARLRKEAKTMGLEPNVWFNNVEVVAAKRIGRETVQYVSNIFKYYVAYRLLADKLHPAAGNGATQNKKRK